MSRTAPRPPARFGNAISVSFYIFPFELRPIIKAYRQKRRNHRKNEIRPNDGI
nr:MAG TPA: hypothetical protein [Caudoviricetes sp.]